MQFYASMISPSPPPGSGSAPWFATQGEFLAYVAGMPFKAAGLVGFTGSVQQLDPAFFESPLRRRAPARCGVRR